MKEIQFTLYDIFGYLVPGAIASCAIGIVLGTLLLDGPFEPREYPAGVWVAILVGAYIIGHLTQAVANQVVRLFPSTVRLTFQPGSRLGLQKEIVEEVAWRVRRLACLRTAPDLKPETLYEICDHYVMQHCRTEARDIYVYREGFYRGLFVSAVLLGVALLARLPFPMSEIVFASEPYTITRAEMVSAAVVSFICGWLAFQRYRRFGSYLAKFAVYSTLLVEPQSPAASSD